MRTRSVIIPCAFLLLSFMPAPAPQQQPYFTGGNAIEFSQTDIFLEKERTSRLTLEVDSVFSEGGRLHAVCLLYQYNTDGGRAELVYRYGYGRDSLNFYALATNWFYPWYGNDESIHFTCSGDTLIYPFNMKAGDSLPGGKVFREMIRPHFHSVESELISTRYVTGTDSVNTFRGTEPAWIIHCTSNRKDKSELTGMGPRETNDILVIKEWFVPGLGVVKQQREELGKPKTRKTTVMKKW